MLEEDGRRSAFIRRLGVESERMNRTRQLRGERRINHAMALDAALPFEGVRHNIHPEVRLAAGPVACVPLMQM